MRCVSCPALADEGVATADGRQWLSGGGRHVHRRRRAGPAVHAHDGEAGKHRTPTIRHESSHKLGIIYTPFCAVRFGGRCGGCDGCDGCDGYCGCCGCCGCCCSPLLSSPPPPHPPSRLPLYCPASLRLYLLPRTSSCLESRQLIACRDHLRGCRRRGGCGWLRRAAETAHCSQVARSTRQTTTALASLAKARAVVLLPPPPPPVPL